MGSRMSPGDVESRRQNRTLRQKNCATCRDWVRRSDENPGKWTNEPERGKMGSMRNALFEFRLGRESIADRGLTRCSLKMQQRISEIRQLFVVSCQLQNAG